jgi:hypothetical protein
MFMLERRLLLFMTFNKFDNVIGRKRCAQPSCSGQSQRRGESLTHTPESANWPLYDGLGCRRHSLGGLENSLTFVRASTSECLQHHRTRTWLSRHFITLPIALAEESRTLELDREGSYRAL